MKAFVIKNKEGKYKEPHLDIREFYSSSLVEAEMWTERKDAEYFCPKDCEVVEITIAEGDLEKENEELKEELGKLVRRYVITEKDEEIKELREQLAEKDKEIRKQVCDEIREKLQLEIIQIDDGLHCCSQDVVYWQDICSVVDQIEQAKESINENRNKI